MIGEAACNIGLQPRRAEDTLAAGAKDVVLPFGLLERVMEWGGRRTDAAAVFLTP